ncbi:conserved hypothetical protein [Abyssogena phaseoliformis symbiont OG214]|uniref:hypothetical protein n=1 Tax=Abyssogena phaseoliformis symbiont TaxID=596095 RepID=UPI001916C4BB|nr:hypothetical protein [Abyssogena phaseoliformis symbiont]MBW5289222.1 hypothetical protein [Candidatus Ruthia sp. Apha_13_S6]BBB22750.1 conserved hypothetical protein [Abyssogena phaseoliformis symbiont OG214]
MKNILKHSVNMLVPLLITITIAILILAIYNIFGLAPEAIIGQSKMSSLPAIAISAGVLIASITYLSNKSSQAVTHQRKRDELYLSITRESFDEVYGLLKDKNNDRIVWVRASRLLLKTLAIKSKIQTPGILDAFKLAEERLRNELYRSLSVKSDIFSSRQPLPPQFFYGIADWKTEISLDEAAKKSSSKIEAHLVEIDKNLPEPEMAPLSAKTVIAIFDFMEFPKDYDDPLPNVEEWTDNWKDTHGIEQGAKRYIAHKNSQKG